MRSLSLLCLVSLCLGQSFAFRTSVLLRLLLYLDTYGGAGPLGVGPTSIMGVEDQPPWGLPMGVLVLPQFLKKVTDIIASKLCIIFRRLFRL